MRRRVSSLLSAFALAGCAAPPVTTQMPIQERLAKWQGRVDPILDVLLKWPGSNGPTCNLAWTREPSVGKLKIGDLAILKNLSVPDETVYALVKAGLETASNLPKIFTDEKRPIYQLRTGECAAELVSNSIITGDVAFVESTIVGTRMRVYILGWQDEKWIPWAVAERPVT